MEVFLLRRQPFRARSRFLHVRGGVSRTGRPKRDAFPFSPRAWRCFRGVVVANPFKKVFSTCVEVFLSGLPWIWLCVRFLHVRGGVSRFLSKDIQIQLFSPRAWRCFSWKSPVRPSPKVFSTCVEVFLATFKKVDTGRGFLHVRGGVSALSCIISLLAGFSPRAWRCF